MNKKIETLIELFSLNVFSIEKRTYHIDRAIKRYPARKHFSYIGSYCYIFKYKASSKICEIDIPLYYHE